MNFIESLYQTVKKKISNEEKAKLLNLSLEEFLVLKDETLGYLQEISPKVDEQVVSYLQSKFKGENPDEEESRLFEIHENLEKGTAKMSGVSSTEPRSSEEIIKILKIDTKKWKLSQYWNKEQGSKWLVSALVTRVKESEELEDTFFQLLETYKLPEFEAPVIVKSKSELDKASALISLQDLHVGKQNNGDIGVNALTAVKDLMTKASRNYHLEETVLVLGGDLLNSDTFEETTTKGTVVNNDLDAVNMYMKAFDILCVIIPTIADFTDKVKIVFIPGNHDRISSFHLLHALSMCFAKWSNITFDVKYEERKVHTYGLNMLCFEHGDSSSIKNNPLVYAVEYPEEWGKSRFRKLYTGHLHTKRSKEYITENEEHGFSTKIIPSLSATDYWHYHKKFVGNRKAAVLEVNDYNKGTVAEYVYVV